MKISAANLLLLLLGLLPCLTGCQQQETSAADRTAAAPAAETAPVEKPRPAVQFDVANAAVESRIADDLNYLASDEREGRGPYSDGLEEASQYIAEQFELAGLNTRLIEGKPFQVFSKRDRVKLGEQNQLQLVAADGTTIEVPQSDYQPLSPTTTGAFDLPLTFAGYGITSPRDAYDDFAEFDAKGKAVIVLRHEPDQTGKTQKFAGSGNSKFAYLSTKIVNAIEHDAAAILIVTDEAALSKPGSGDDKLLSFQIRMPLDFDSKIPVVHVKRSMIDAMLKQAGKPSLAEWERKVDQDLKPNSFDLAGAHVRGEIDVETSKRTQKNVLGVLPGRGKLASEVVVVGAHYDHLGRGGSGSLAPWTKDIHNGADDNASGTVALLETMRQCVAFNGPDQRTMLFIAFAAEEQGLIGSEYYVRHPLFDIENTKAMLNYDMVGRLRKEKLTLYGFDTAKEFEGWVDAAAEKQGITLAKVPGGYGPSDHASFYGRGIPVMHDFTGFHSQYHRPSDDIEHINVPGIRKIVAMNIDILKHLVVDEIHPVVGSEGSMLDIYLGGLGLGKPGGEKKDPDQTRRALGVNVGDPTANGLPIVQVTKGGVAEVAGLRGGDLLLTWGGQKVQSIERLRDIVRAASQGEKISVRVMRGMLELELEVEFPK
ncbi:M20/M25/M40 family metallo-hydrolase [Bremerella cremea]|uniref:M20/M25/M40 family metallo-hydrolase n=1 Tax=Bremerella cremea TaxID=1031537 RepID=UPI0031EB95D6